MVSSATMQFSPTAMVGAVLNAELEDHWSSGGDVLCIQGSIALEEPIILSMDLGRPDLGIVISLEGTAFEFPQDRAAEEWIAGVVLHSVIVVNWY